MKFTIEGFSQKKAVELGLSSEDLVILRWFVDFQGSDKMIKFTTDDGIYTWVNYNYFLEDMPIIKCNRKNLAAKFQHLVDAGVLKHKTIKQGGTFSVYCFGAAYSKLIATSPMPEKGEGIPKTGHPVPKPVKRVDCKQDTPLPENSRTNIHLLKDSSTKENIKESDQVVDESSHKPLDASRQAKTFTPPTMEEVKAYCKERRNHINPQKFIDFYETNGWVQGKARKPIKSWKACVRTWENQDKDSNVSVDHTEKKKGWGGYLC